MRRSKNPTHPVADAANIGAGEGLPAREAAEDNRGLSVRDITDEVAAAVKESGVRDGIVCVYSPHTTCCVRVNEFEDGFLEDFTALSRASSRATSTTRTTTGTPHGEHLRGGHDRRERPSHCMSMLLGSAGEAIPIRDGELCLGTWQRVLFLELDRERDRRWIVRRRHLACRSPSRVNPWFPRGPPPCARGRTRFTGRSVRSSVLLGVCLPPGKARLGGASTSALWTV